MLNVTGLYAQLVEYETDYSGLGLIEWTRDHAELPIFAVALYLGMVTYGPTYMPFELKLGRLFAVWNIALCLFSVLGATRVVPALLSALTDPAHGATFADRFVWTCCTDPVAWYLNGPSGLWVGLFIFSKFPELLDTAFLVLQKKRVIFLHWFHHTTVLLYCWHAFHHRIAPGLWFAAMNFSVHSVMYGYYFLSCSAVGLRKYVRPIAPFITFIQIAQMFVGISVTVTAAVQHSNDEDSCFTDKANWKLGLGMYGSYFLLFVVLFFNLYCTEGRGHRQSSGVAAAKGGTAAGSAKSAAAAKKNPCKKATEFRTGCDVGDAAGFFRGKSEAQERREAELRAKQA